jgi:hypothetical protein
VRGENLTDNTIFTRIQDGSVDIVAPRTVWAGIKLGL